MDAAMQPGLTCICWKLCGVDEFISDVEANVDEFNSTLKAAVATMRRELVAFG